MRPSFMSPHRLTHGDIFFVCVCVYVYVYVYVCLCVCDQVL
jgi:hypothetical protein